MVAVTFINTLFNVLLILTALAWVKIRWPESAVGKMIAVIA